MAINTKIVPSVSLVTMQDSNIYMASGNEVSSSILQVTPRFDIAAQDRANTYSFRYTMQLGLYSKNNNNYDDHKFDLASHIEPNDRLRFDAGASYNLLHDDLGTAGTEGLAPSVLSVRNPDEYDNAVYKAGVEYGAKEATGQLAFNTNLNQKRYNTAAVAVTRDMDTWNNTLEFRLRMAPKTKALLNLEYNKGNYDHAVTAAVSDYTETNYFAGVTWESTAATTGKIRIGNGKRETPTFSKTKMIWDLGVQWSPLPRDVFSFNTGKRFQDGNNATTIDNTTYSLSWTHDWLERLQSSANYSLSKEDYQGSTRADDTQNYGVSVNYQVRRWFVLGGGITVKDRSSTNAGFSYDRTVFALNAQLSL